MQNHRIISIFDDDAMRRKTKESLNPQKVSLQDHRLESDFIRCLRTNPDLAILGLNRISDECGLSLIKRIRQIDRSIPVIVINRHSSEASVIASLRAGVSDYIKFPFMDDVLNSSLRRLLPNAVQDGMKHGTDDGMVGNSLPMRELKENLVQVAGTDCTVLLTGETGTGKELAAELIHRLGRRKKQPFICINCAAIPDTLLESELFGHAKGAFTGAYAAYGGKLKSADSGTVFFDEISEMTPYAQAKILRILEHKKVVPLGENRSVDVDIRFIAATNKNIEALVLEEGFRKDLYYRLNVVRIHLPALRERKEDIPALVGCFVREMNRRHNRNVDEVTPETITILLHYDWPGNVRELKNVIEAAFIHPLRNRIAPKHLPKPFLQRIKSTDSSEGEKERVLSALLSTDWNKSKAATKLQWSRMTLYRKMEKYNISPRPHSNRVTPPERGQKSVTSSMPL